MRPKWIFTAALATALAWLAGGADAQTRYTCRTSNGTQYVSTQPCPSNVIIYGPTERESPYQAPIPKIGEAPSTLRYMSPRCASLNDAIRTAYARGLKSETVSEMRRNYNIECAESDADARSRMSQDRGDQQQQRRQEKEAEKMERDRASMREQQCGESKRILFTKRARTDLTEGEKAELKRFEDNYRSRCG